MSGLPFQPTMEGQIENCSEVTPIMDSLSVFEKLEKEAQKILVECQQKTTKDQERIKELEQKCVELEKQSSEKTSIINMQQQKIEDLQSECLAKDAIVKELRDQATVNNSSIKDQSQKSDEQKRSSATQSSTADRLKKSNSNINQTGKKRHPSVGSMILTCNAPERKSRENSGAVWGARGEETSPPTYDSKNFPGLIAVNQSCPIPEVVQMPIPKQSAKSSSQPITDNPNKGRIYTDSNTHNVPHFVQERMDEIEESSGKKARIEFFRSNTMQETLKAVQEESHENTLVVINVGTNNIRRAESPASIQLLQEEIIWFLKHETAVSNIVFMEAPPSVNFNIDPYNRSTQALCRKMKVKFSKTLICKGHLADDGYHVRYEFQHIMLRSVAAAILDVDPFKALSRQRLDPKHCYFKRY